MKSNCHMTKGPWNSSLIGRTLRGPISSQVGCSTCMPERGVGAVCLGGPTALENHCVPTAHPSSTASMCPSQMFPFVPLAGAAASL